MKITIKNVKYLAHASQDSHCFEAVVYVDDKRAFRVTNSGHGGSDDYHPAIKGENYADVNKRVGDINAILEKETIKTDFGELQNDLELVVGELVNEWLIDREIKKTLKKLCYVKDGSIYTLAAKHKPTVDNIAAVQKAEWWKPEYKLLNGLPIEEIRKYF